MSKTATKAADSAFNKARMAAAKWNDKLNSREGAAELTGLDRTRLAHIELGTINPHPEEVIILADTYNAPELHNYFCCKLCPLGIKTVDEIELVELERAVLQLMFSLKDLPNIEGELVEIAADGVIGISEKPLMTEIIKKLNDVALKIQSLKLMFQKQCCSNRTK